MNIHELQDMDRILRTALVDAQAYVMNQAKLPIDSDRAIYDEYEFALRNLRELMNLAEKGFYGN